MKRLLILSLCSIFLASGCTKVPITGRKQLNLLPESQMMAMSFSSYSDFLNQNKVMKGGGDAQMVKRTGRKIATAVSQFLRQKKQMKRVKDFNWEFNLVDDPQVNAWCMPGGKVVVYTGILPITKTEAGLAVVMGHEVAHAVARHGNERMSQGLAVQMGGLGLMAAMSQKPAATQQLFYQAYGLGSTLGMLKYSRTHESEADKMGLIFMAMAGYNPQESVPFWQRMRDGAKGQAPPEFMSTHPSHNTRITDLQKFMPTALKYYRKS